MKKYIKADSYLSDKAYSAMTKLQNASNEVVDAIIELGNKFPEIQSQIQLRDQQDAPYYDEPDEMAKEFLSDINSIIKDLTSATEQIENVLDYYYRTK